MDIAERLSQDAFDALCRDPEVWATHGMPNESKEKAIVSRFAAAIRIALNHTSVDCAGHQSPE